MAESGKSAGIRYYYSANVTQFKGYIPIFPSDLVSNAFEGFFSEQGASLPPLLPPVLSLSTFARHNCTQSSRPIEVGIVQDEKAAVKSAQLGRDKRAKDALHCAHSHSEVKGAPAGLLPKMRLICNVHPFK